MEQNTIDLRAILGTLRRQATLIVIAFAVVMGLAVLLLFSITPTFTASSVVFIDPTTKNLLDPSTQTFSPVSDSARVESEIELMRSDNLLLQVIKSKDLLTDPEFGLKLGLRAKILAFLRIRDEQLPSGDEALQSVMSKLHQATSIRRIGNTYLVSVAVTSTSAERAAQLSNAISKAYVDTQLRSKIQNVLNSRDVLQGLLNDSSKQVLAAERAVDDYLSNNIGEIVDKTGRVDIALLNDNLSSLQKQSAENGQKAQLIRQSLDQQDWASLSSELQSDALAELVRQRDETLQRLQSADTQTETAVNLRQELASINDQLKTTAQQNLSDLRQTISDQQKSIGNLREEIRNDVLNSNIPPEYLTELYELQQNAGIARNQYQELLAQLRSLEAQSQAQIADSRVVSEALPPTYPSSPNVRFIILVAGVLGLGIGLALAFVYENFVGGYTSEQQVESVLKLAAATSVPRDRTIRKSPIKEEMLSAADLMHLAPMSQYAESIRRLRAFIDQGLRTQPLGESKDKDNGTIIMVTSAIPAEGKSTIALSLGRAYANAGRGAFLIDGDLRRPSLHRYLGVESDHGIGDYVDGKGSRQVLSDLLVQDPHSDLAAMISSKNSNRPTDQLVSSEEVGQLIENTRSVFRYIIVDTPPILSVVDAMYLAEHADAVAFVIDWASTSQQDTREALKMLRSSVKPNTKIIGVLNQINPHPKGSARRYSMYYQEGNQA